MKFFTSAVAALATAFASATAARAAIQVPQEPAHGDPWAGAWSGAAADERGAAFDMQIRFNRDGTARIFYPGRNCAGYLQAHATVGGARVYGASDAPDANASCFKGQTVVIQRDATGYLRYRALAAPDTGPRRIVGGVLRQSGFATFAAAAPTPKPGAYKTLSSEGAQSSTGAQLEPELAGGR